jgi:hypothetical protein
MADEPKIAPDCPLCPDPNCGQPMVGPLTAYGGFGHASSPLLTCVGCGETRVATPDQLRQARKADNANAQKHYRRYCRDLGRPK